MNDALGWAMWVAIFTSVGLAVVAGAAVQRHTGCGGGPTTFERYSIRAYLISVPAATALSVAYYLT